MSEGNTDPVAPVETETPPPPPSEDGGAEAEENVDAAAAAEGEEATAEVASDKEPTAAEPAAPAKKEPSRIFLFELILDKLQLSYCTEFMNRCYKGPNCISFRFLKQGPYTICQNRPILRESADKKTGTSSLFSLTAAEMDEARKEFIVDFEVFRNTPDGNITLGWATLPVTNLMKCVCALCDANEFRKTLERDEMKKRPASLPARAPEVFSESIHHSVEFTSPPESTCDDAAIISVYVRLTCFGSLITTNCQLSPVCKDDDFPKYVDCSPKCTPRK